MKPTHTPGPWGLMFQNVRGKRMYTVESPGRYALPIADVDCGRAEGTANATLIAAAPDLLEALKTLTDALERNNGGTKDFEYIERAMANARNAIGKARGER